MYDNVKLKLTFYIFIVRQYLTNVNIFITKIGQVAMKLKNLTSLLTNALGAPVNQSMLAQSLGITRQTISNRVKNDSELTVSELAKIEKYFNVNITNQVKGLSSDDILINYYPDVFASCGNGAVVFSDNKEVVSMPGALLTNYSRNKTYSMIHARGDSMSPFIDDDDKLIVEHSEGEQIIDNKIYVFCYKNEFFVKRLAKNVDELIVKSDNSAYAQRTIISKELDDVLVLGRVVGVIRTV